jgi:hypothetical protein
MDGQPEDGEEIVQVNPEYEGHHCMGQRTYSKYCPFDVVVKYYRDNDLGDPNFWWISAKNFPFPDQPERLNEKTPKGDAQV